MSDAEIRDELITMLFAGHETTANSLAWAFYWIHYLPEVDQKLQAELNTLAGNIDFNTIVRLPYLNDENGISNYFISSKARSARSSSPQNSTSRHYFCTCEWSENAENIVVRQGAIGNRQLGK